MRKVFIPILQHFSGKKIFALFLLTNLVYAAMLTITIPMVMSYTGDLALLDMSPTGYSAAYVENLLHQLGPEGRSAYLYRQIPVDMVYPFLFGCCYSLLFAYLLQQLNPLNSRYFYICLLPIVAGMADYLENLGIIHMLITYPDLSQLVIAGSNIFTILKSVATTFYFIALIVALIFWALKKRSKVKSV